MPKQENPKRKKGTFSDIRLPVAMKYIFPVSRRPMIVSGGIVALMFLLFYFINTSLQSGSFISPGPLSSNHANFEENCQKCHELGKMVTIEKCSVCHEKTSNDFGIYKFSAHYLYKSKDVRKVEKSSLEYSDREMLCFSCHMEHRGRNASITKVSDRKCIRCHEYGSFNSAHPEFEFADKNIPDDSTLIMTHNRHTGFVLKALGSPIIEEACLSCHNPDPDGKNFTDINYDLHCGDCHIGPEKQTVSLPIRDPKNPDEPGVETIEMIKQRGGPGVSWAFYMNPNVLSGRSSVKKRPIYHKDPWIMENLKQIRKKLYPSDGLDDLLRTTGVISDERVDSLYNEAISVLQEHADELRGRPERVIKEELAKLDSLIRKAKRKLKLPSTPRNPATFSMVSSERDVRLTDRKEEFEQLVFDLTEKNGPECQKCHLIDRARIARVQKNQDVLIRAKFDHRAHIIDRRCLECHVEIAMSDSTIRENKTGVEDKSATQNLPKIASCMQCHNDQQVSNRCVTCHDFHPNKMERSNLRLFMEN